MNIENIHDALNLLDDDMIEAVEQLRNEKSQSINKYKKGTWIRWVAMAACLCLVVGSYYLTDGFGLLSHKGANSDSLKGESSNGTPDYGEGEATGTVTENDSEDGTDVTDDMSSKKESSLSEKPSVLVEILAWNENGFTGIITGIVDTEKYPVGEKVSVKFSQSIPDKKAFPEGSTVRVQFDKSEIIEHPYMEAQEEIKIILYAEKITLDE